MENDAEKICSELRADISTYAGLRFRLLKLLAIERAAGIISALSHGLILMFFVFFTILFLFIALGFFLGDLLGNIALGFLIVGGIYGLLTIGFILVKEKVCMKLMNVIISALRMNEDHDDNDKENQSTDTARTINPGEEGGQTPMPGIGNEN